MVTVNIANDFSLYPGGRYYTDGEFSGEEFRNKFIIPYLDNNEIVKIELDGTRGYGSSFLEEAFGGLVRLGYSPDMLLKNIILITRKDMLKSEIIGYIMDATNNG